MSSYLLRRLLIAIPTFLGMTFLVYALVRAIQADVAMDAERSFLLFFTPLLVAIQILFGFTERRSRLLFFGRISGQAGDFQDYRAEFLHDFVVPRPSYAIGILDPAGFCSHRDALPPGDYGGWLISELCGQNGFLLTDLALSLIELEALVQSGGGQVTIDGYEHPVPSVAQYRDILNRLLGSDTTNAFAVACWPPELFGNSYTVSPDCITYSTGGTATPIP